MAFDLSTLTPRAPSPALPNQLQTSMPAPQQTLLERVAVREAAQDLNLTGTSVARRQFTFADFLFAAIISTLSIIAALAGILAALVLIGLGLAIFIAPVIGAVFVSVVAISGLALGFRKQIQTYATRISSRGYRSAIPDCVQSA